MNEFLSKLYSYQNFSFYLIISVIVLVVLFFVVLFYGKKDQKKREIEATKKLQQIESEDAFKEEETEERAEFKALDDAQKLENDTIIVPTIEDFYNEDKNTEAKEDVFEALNTDATVPILPIEENEEKIVESKALDLKPLFEQEEKPLVLNEEIEASINDKKAEENNNDAVVLEEVSVPTFNFEEVMNSAILPKEDLKDEIDNKKPDVFSSVYVPPKEEVTAVPEVKKEISVEKEDKPVFEVKNDEFELPALKKEEPKKVDMPEVKEEKKEEFEMPILNNYNLDELSGETYTINK